MECLDIDSAKNSKIKIAEVSNCNELCSILHEFYHFKAKGSVHSIYYGDLFEGIHTAILSEHKRIEKFRRDKLSYSQEFREIKKLHSIAVKHSAADFLSVVVSKRPKVIMKYIQDLLQLTPVSRLCAVFKFSCCLTKKHSGRCRLKWKCLISVFQDLCQDDDGSDINSISSSEIDFYLCYN